jgi:SAM-dependent methyltransferase
VTASTLAPAALRRPAPTSLPGRAELVALLDRLFRAQLAEEPDNRYLLEHGRGPEMLNHVRTFEWYRAHLPEAGHLLEWGCQHAPDSCLLRASYGDRYRLSACDILPAERYRHFRDFAGVEYRRLTDLVALPYESNSFDGMIASGVLEHVAMDYESLKEVHRVLRPGAPLVIGFLPNWLSHAEWRNRTFRGGGHQRRYGLGETTRLLLRTGFLPTFRGDHTFVWENLATSLGLGDGGWLPSVLRHLVPIHKFCATLRFVAVKVTYM